MDAGLADLDIASMALLGLFGVGHCIGMCGPLVIAFPVRIGVFSAQLWYHLGRIATYTLVGLILGALGGTLGRLGLVAHLQVGLGAGAAVFLLLFGLARIGLIREPRMLQVASPAMFAGRRTLRKLMTSKRPIGMLPLGLLLGFLPCGLSYAAFARALPAGGAVEGAVLLGAFGAGTLPGLLLLGTAAARLMRKYRVLSDILSGMLMIAMAVDLGAEVLGAIF